MIFTRIFFCFLSQYKTPTHTHTHTKNKKKKQKKKTATSDAYIYWRFLHYNSNVNYGSSISPTYLTSLQSYGSGSSWYNPSCAGLANGNFVITGMYYLTYYYAGTFIINKNGGIVKTWFRGDQGNIYSNYAYYARVGSIPVGSGGFLVHWSYQGSSYYLGRSFDDNGNALTADKSLYTYSTGGPNAGVCGISLGGYLVCVLRFFFCFVFLLFVVFL